MGSPPTLTASGTEIPQGLGGLMALRSGPRVPSSPRGWAREPFPSAASLPSSPRTEATRLTCPAGVGAN